MSENLEPVATVTNENGDTRTITASELLEAVDTDRRGRLQEIIDEHLTMLDDSGGGLAHLKIDSPLREFGAQETIPLIDFDVSLRPGEYLVLFPHGAADIPLENGIMPEALEPGKDGLLLAISPDLIEGDGGRAAPVAVELTDSETGEIVEGATVHGWAIEGMQFEGFATLYDLLQALTAAAALRLTLERALKEEEEESKGRRKRPDLTSVLMANDPATNAVFGRGRNHLEAKDYHSGEIKYIPTGKNMELGIRIETAADINEAEERYIQGENERFWYDNALSIAAQGAKEIKGSDLLIMGGYKNPYAKDMSETMQDAADAMVKFTGQRIALDTSRERAEYFKKRGIELVQSTALKPFISADIYFEEYREGDSNYFKDFTMYLKAEAGGEPVTAFALSPYSRAKGMLIPAEAADLEFKGMRLKQEHRVMWRWVLRQIRYEKRSNKILFETMFKELGYTEALDREMQRIKSSGLEESEIKKKVSAAKTSDRKKRQRMLNQLRKMLNRRKEEKRLDYVWEERKGVTITEIEPSN